MVNPFIHVLGEFAALADEGQRALAGIANRSTLNKGHILSQAGTLHHDVERLGRLLVSHGLLLQQQLRVMVRLAHNRARVT